MPEVAPPGVAGEGKAVIPAVGAPRAGGCRRLNPSSAVVQFHDFTDEDDEAAWRAWPDPALTCARS